MRRLFFPGCVHPGHAAPGPQRRKPDHVHQPERLQHFPVETAFEQLLAFGGEDVDVTDAGDDVRRRHRALRILASQPFKEFRLVSEYEQLIVMHVPHVVHANAAPGAFTEIGNLPAGLGPLLRSSAQS